MNHIEYIESSKTWVCPKTGRWKAICVGGGASGGVYFASSIDDGTIKMSPGCSTSFGAHITAEGGKKLLEKNKADIRGAAVGGEGGFDTVNYGGLGALKGIETLKSSGNGGFFGAQGTGYGAGGGAQCDKINYLKGSTSGNSAVYNIGGKAGSLKTGIFELEHGESVICTVGKGGSISSLLGTPTQVLDFILSSAASSTSATEVTVDEVERIKQLILDGVDGIIILQYLGE